MKILSYYLLFYNNILFAYIAIFRGYVLIMQARTCAVTDLNLHGDVFITTSLSQRRLKTLIGVCTSWEVD